MHSDVGTVGAGGWGGATIFPNGHQPQNSDDVSIREGVFRSETGWNC